MEEHTDFYILNDISSDAMKNVLDLNKDLEKDPDYKIGEEAFDQIHTYVDRCVNSKKSTYRNFNFSKYLAKGRAMQQIKDGHFQSASSTLSKNSLFMKKY
jgi:tripartite-type tricarboxylate transporter receptor subunit TctC